MKIILEIIIFPFFVCYSILEALIANPLKFNVSKNGLEIGIVPLAIIILACLMI